MGDYTVAERQRRFRARQAIEAQRQAKALRRMSLACDRVIRKENPEQAARWAKAWAMAAGVRTRGGK
jgi:hypothetical protein